MSGFTLRDYQERGVQQIRDSFGRTRRVLYQCPTGGGKTVLFGYMAERAAEKGKKIGILVQRRELLKQASNKLGRAHGIILAGVTPTPSAAIQVASVQTLVHRRDKYSFDFLIIDEAHHTTAATYRKILNSNPDAYVLGVTATPCRTDGQGLDDLFDELITGPSVKELTARGFLSRAEVYAPREAIDIGGVHSRMGDFVRAELDGAADTPTITGDAIEHYRKYANGEAAIAFCVSVSHAEHVADAFRGAGYSARHVDGGMSQVDRDEVIAGLGDGTVQVVTSCDLISEGVDIPNISCGLLLRPTKSLGLFLQQVGRCLRVAPGKDRAIILDHAGNCRRHGMMPDTEHEWTLEGTSRRRAQQEERGERVRECPECFAVFEFARACPACGFVFEINAREVREVDGELVPLTEEEIRREKKKEQRSARTVEELEALGESRGYKNPSGWARHIMRSRPAARMESEGAPV